MELSTSQALSTAQALSPAHTLSPAQAAAVALAAEVKAKLVQFALSPPFEKYLRRIGRELAREAPDTADPGVEMMERLLFSFTFDDGSTVMDRFLRRPGLGEAAQAMARGFMDGVHGFFEVVADTGPGADVFDVRCCLSDLQHLVAPTLPAGIPELPQGWFLAGRLNPVAGTELWTPSGMLETIPAPHREVVAQAVLEMSMQSPWLTHRNPEKLQKATERVAQVHRSFVARHGSDLVLVAGQDLPGVFAEAIAPAGDPDSGALARGRAMAAATIEDSELVHEDQVLVHSHSVAGISFYQGFVAVARALEAGAEAAEDDMEFLRGYLHEPSIPAWLLRRIVTDRLPAAESAVARAVGRPGFDWEQDGEELLASLPGDMEPKVTLSIVPSISESLRRSPG